MACFKRITGATVLGIPEGQRKGPADSIIITSARDGSSNRINEIDMYMRKFKEVWGGN